MNNFLICGACESVITPGSPCSKCFPVKVEAAKPTHYRPMQRSPEHTELLEASKRRWLAENGETETSYQTKVLALKCRAQANDRTVHDQAMQEIAAISPEIGAVLRRRWAKRDAENEKESQG